MCHSNGFTGTGTPAGFSTMLVAMAGERVSTGAAMAPKAPSPSARWSAMAPATGDGGAAIGDDGAATGDDATVGGSAMAPEAPPPVAALPWWPVAALPWW